MLFVTIELLVQYSLAKVNLLNGLAGKEAEWSTKNEFLSASYVPRRVPGTGTMQRCLKLISTLTISGLL